MADTYLNRTFGTPTNNYKWTYSVWFKRQTTGVENYLFQTYPTGEGYTRIFFKTTNLLQFDGEDTSAGNAFNFKTNRLFRDPNAWYHLVIKWDTTQSTASERVKIYINGVEETSLSASTQPAQNTTYPVNRAKVHNIGRHSTLTSTYFNGIMSHIHFCDGYAYDASYFGETDSTTGEWKIKPSPSVTYGNNGFWILKDGNSVTDQSGNSNDFTVANGTLTNTEDCPSNVFATMNPLSKGSNISTSNGNTTISAASGSGDNSILGTIACGNGKYYWEAKCTGASTYANLGVTLSSKYGGNHSGVDSGRVSYSNNGYVYREGLSGQGNTDTGTTFTTNDIIGVAFDTENGTLKFYKNGTLVNTTTDNDLLFSNNEYIPCSGLNYGGFSYNFGNGYFGTTAISSEGTNASGIGKFEYDVPTGYTALSTKGLNE